MVRLAQGAVAAILIAVVGGCADDNRSDPSRLATEQRGDKVVAALDAYRKDRGRYPKSLSDLVPRYIKVIEPPLEGNGRWVYKVNAERQGFALKYTGDTEQDPVGYYSTSSRGWNYDTK